MGENNYSLVAVATGTTIAIISSLLGYYIGAQATIKQYDYDISEDVSDENPQSEPCKMVFVVRKDLPMTKGKIAAQCAHAAVGCYEKAVEKTPSNVITWKSQGQAKIALQCENLHELDQLQMRASRLGLINERIVDAGRTQISPGSATVLGIGPAPVSRINEVTGHLKLL